MKILCFGDSNTFGYDPRSYFGERYSERIRWTGLLDRISGHEIINAGQNGREIPHTPYELEQLRRLISQFSPDLLVIMLGTNDLLNGCSVEETAARMETCLRSVGNTQVLLLSPPLLQPGAWVPNEALIARSGQFSASYQTLARRLHTGFADAADWNVELLFDGVHFSETGHRVFAENLMKTIKGHFG